MISDLSYNYYFDLSEVFDAGLSADDVTVKIGYDEWSQAEALGPYQYKDNIYYIKIKYSDGSVLAPIGKEQEQAEIQVRISIPDQNKVWDSSNDYSIEGLTNDNQVQNITDKITMYDGDTLIWGTEPDGTKATNTVDFKPVIRDNNETDNSQNESSEEIIENTEENIEDGNEVTTKKDEKNETSRDEKTDKENDNTTESSESKYSSVILILLIVIAIFTFGVIIVKKPKE